jgi:hypothetical protein
VTGTAGGVRAQKTAGQVMAAFLSQERGNPASSFNLLRFFSVNSFVSQ